MNVTVQINDFQCTCLNVIDFIIFVLHLFKLTLEICIKYYFATANETKLIIFKKNYRDNTGCDR